MPSRCVPFTNLVYSTTILVCRVLQIPYLYVLLNVEWRLIKLINKGNDSSLNPFTMLFSVVTKHYNPDEGPSFTPVKLFV